MIWLRRIWVVLDNKDGESIEYCKQSLMSDSTVSSEYQKFSKNADSEVYILKVSDGNEDYIGVELEV